MEQILAANISGITQALRVGASDALYGGPGCALITYTQLGKLQGAARNIWAKHSLEGT